MIAKPKPTGQGPTPAVTYIRMSSDRQEASPSQQRAELAKLAKREGYRLLREYFDEGISGDATEKRTAFKQMVADAEEKGDFAAILCWDVDRFGRFDSVEAGHWIYPLRNAGVWLVTISQGVIDWNDFSGRMMYGIIQEGKHQFLIDLSKRAAGEDCRSQGRPRIRSPGMGNGPGLLRPIGQTRQAGALRRAILQTQRLGGSICGIAGRGGRRSSPMDFQHLRRYRLRHGLDCGRPKPPRGQVTQGHDVEHTDH